ncbi:MAG: MFS transporter [Alphaproteobacteria bacterium]
MTDRPPSRAIPAGIWALGFTSLFMDASTELIHSLMPVFLVGVLGTSVATVGVIEGIAEATASIAKVFSGALSDYVGRRKPLTIAGYGIAALTRPLFPLAASVSLVLAARFIDRLGKGIRGAPRDALVGDLAPPELRGASYGLRQSLDTVGAVIGPALAIAAMALLDDDIRAAFWVAVVPAIASVSILIIAVREPARPEGDHVFRTPIRVSNLKALGLSFWLVAAIGGVLTLARFSEAFLVLRAESVGLGPGLVPLVMVVMSVVYAAAAYPAGRLSDRLGRRGLIGLGFAILIGADLVLALADGILGALIGSALWGLHMGLTQGLLAALVADSAPKALRGTAFGAFNLLSGLALLAASALAGSIWDAYGAPTTFFTGAVIAAVGLPGLLALRPHAAP